jgi:tRNA-splicing ligase RtcB
MLTSLTCEEIKPQLRRLVEAIYDAVPVGVGASGAVKVGEKTLRKVCVEGAHWAVENGYGSKEDLERIEDTGKLSPANPCFFQSLRTWY